MGKGGRGIFNAHPAWVDVVVAGRDDSDECLDEGLTPWENKEIIFVQISLLV